VPFARFGPLFAYETVHRYFLQSRRKWFNRPAGK
jgi:hypothetical protein